MFKNNLIKFVVFSILLALPLAVFAKKTEVKRVNTVSNKLKTKIPGYQNELLVIGTIKDLYAKQFRFYATVGVGNFGTFYILYLFNMIDANLAAGDKYGYIFTLQAQPASSMFPSRFFVYARPKVYRKTGKRSFYMNSGCLVRGADKNGEDAYETDPIIDSCTPTIAVSYEKDAIQGIRTINSAEFTYQATVGSGLFGDLNQLRKAGLISDSLGTGSFARHLWTTNTIPPTITTPANYKTWATPHLYRETGIRSFYIDATGVLRGADRQGGQADENDPPIEN